MAIKEDALRKISKALKTTTVALSCCMLLSACADIGAAKNAVVIQDYATARAHFEYLSKRGFPQAQAKLGDMYLNGLGGEKDPVKALALFRQAEKQENYPEAILAIGKIYRSGLGVPVDTAKARSYFERARDLGVVNAYVQFGLIEQEAGRHAAAEDSFQKAIAKGDTGGGWAALGGLRIAQNRLQEAEDCITKSINSGNVNGWSDLGRVHSLQDNFALAEKDFTRALKETGKIDLLIKIGDAQIQQGKFKEAEDNYRLALAQGLTEANNKIVSSTAKRAVLRQDYATARTNYEYLAERGFPQAQTKLGDMYLNGLGVKKDEAKALALFELAEKQENYPDAILSIGKMYRAGLGVRADAAKAKSYFVRARDLGAVGAYTQLGLLEQDASHYAAAEENFRTAIEKGDTVGGWAALGNLRIAQGRLREAEDSIKKSIALGSLGGWMDLGRLHVLQGRRDLAEQDFEHALKESGNSQILLKIGNIQLEQGKFKQAEDTYKLALGHGLIEANLKIASMYANGNGRPADYAAALVWLYRARADGVTGLERKISQTEKKLRPEDLAKALKSFSEYKKGKSK